MTDKAVEPAIDSEKAWQCRAADVAAGDESGSSDASDVAAGDCKRCKVNRVKDRVLLRGNKESNSEEVSGARTTPAAN